MNERAVLFVSQQGAVLHAGLCRPPHRRGHDREARCDSKSPRHVSACLPDLRVEIKILVKAKDRVAWQRTLRATHKGDFKGFPAAGRPIVWRDMVTSRFRDSLIAEDWLITDLAERLLLARKR